MRSGPSAWHRLLTPFGDIPRNAGLAAAFVIWALVLGAWAIATYGGFVPGMFLPVPDSVVAKGIKLTSDGSLWVHLWA